MPVSTCPLFYAIRRIAPWQKDYRPKASTEKRAESPNMLPKMLHSCNSIGVPSWNRTRHQPVRLTQGPTQRKEGLSDAPGAKSLSEYRPVQIAGQNLSESRPLRRPRGKKSVGMSTCTSRRAGICRNIDLCKPFSCTSRISDRISPSHAPRGAPPGKYPSKYRPGNSPFFTGHAFDRLSSPGSRDSTQTQLSPDVAFGPHGDDALAFTPFFCNCRLPSVADSHPYALVSQVLSVKRSEQRPSLLVGVALATSQPPSRQNTTFYTHLPAWRTVCNLCAGGTV